MGHLQSALSAHSSSTSNDSPGIKVDKYFAEDTIKNASTGEIGIVLYGEGDEDSVVGQDEHSDDDSEDSEDPKEYQVVPEGHVSVYWPRLKERSFVPIKDLSLLDRSFLPGDVCVRSSDDSLKGTVVSSRLLATVQLYDNLEIITEVDTKLLEPIQPYRPDSYVATPAGFIYRIAHCYCDVKVEFPTGLTLTFSDTDESLVSVDDDEVIDGCPFFPTQKVKIEVSELVKRKLVPRGKYHSTHLVGVVQEVKPTKLDADWSFDAKKFTEDEECDQSLGIADVKPLNYFSNNSFAIGDRAYFMGEHSSVPTDLYNRACIVLKTRMLVDILWQDRTINKDMDTTLLSQCQNVLDHDFWPNDYVTDLDENFSAQGYMAGVNPKKFGYIFSSSTKDRTCQVRWMIDTEYEASHPSPEIPEAREPEAYSFFDTSSMRSVFRVHEEVVSSYDIKAVYECQAGDIVIRLGQEIPPEVNSDPELGHYSCIGEIIGFHEGQIRVRWMTGDFEWAYPQQLLIIQMDEDADDEEEDQTSEYSSERDDQRQQRRPYTHSQPNAKVGDVNPESDAEWESCSEEDDLPEHSDDTEDSTSPGTAVSKSDETHTTNTVIPDSKGDSTSPTETTELSIVNESNVVQVNPQTAVEEQTTAGDRLDKTTCPDLITTPFALLDSAPSDHHYIEKPSVIVGRVQFARKMQEDYQLFESSLPAGIAVRAYMDRMDLLRAVIAGPKDTPYEDALFFFDIHLSDYPRLAPVVFYRSYCSERLNPNLYESGNVCLSILGTWHGSSVELWDPKTSNIMRVLISIQALVLIDFPYFNEAGYEKQRGTTEGQRNSLQYNETATLLTVRSMISSLQGLPEGYEPLARSHYRSRREAILTRLEALQNSDASSGCTGGKLYPEPLSVGFCASLKRLYPTLKRLLEEL